MFKGGRCTSFSFLFCDYTHLFVGVLYGNGPKYIESYENAQKKQNFLNVLYICQKKKKRIFTLIFHTAELSTSLFLPKGADLIQGGEKREGMFFFKV